MNIKYDNYGAERLSRKGATTLSIDCNKRRAISQLLAILGLLTVLFGATPSYAQAWTQVQGRLVGNGYYGASPVRGAALTLFNSQIGRTTRSISQSDGTFYFRNIPLGWYNVEVWFPHSPYPFTFRAIVNRIPVSNIGTFQLNIPVGGVQTPAAAGSGLGYDGWLQSGL